MHRRAKLEGNLRRKPNPKGAQAGARMARFLNRKSQRRDRLKFADTYYGELNHYGMYWLKWADVRR